MKLLGSQATRAVNARNEHGKSVEWAWTLRGICLEFARNVILSLQGYKFSTDCTVTYKLSLVVRKPVFRVSDQV